MSHFSVLVVTDEEPTDDLLGKILQPWHEFECTGIDDEYVQDVDRLPEARVEWERRQTSDDDFSKGQTLAEFIQGWYGLEIAESEADIDLANGHKYGHVLVANGEVVRAVDRTNPNKKWDWWTVGGRYSGKFGAAGNTVRVDRIDWDALKHSAVGRREARVAEIQTKAAATREDVERGIHAVRAGHAEWLTLPDPRPRGLEYADWLAKRHGWLARKVNDASWSLPDVGADQSLADWIAAAEPLTAFAFVKDGEWHERGEMGWFACVSNEKPADQWRSELDGMFRTLRPDQWVACVDCHI